MKTAPAEILVKSENPPKQNAKLSQRSDSSGSTKFASRDSEILLGNHASEKSRIVNLGMKKNLESGWEVEWCYSVERDGDGIDPDTAKHAYRDFETRESAIAFAETILSKDVFGSVAINEFYSEPYEVGLPATFREYMGRTEYVEKE